jgi:hypothetical protein
MTAIGSAFATYGTVIMIYNREISGRKHFHNTHSISGEIQYRSKCVCVEDNLNCIYRLDIWNSDDSQRLIWLLCSLFDRVEEIFKAFFNEGNPQLPSHRLLRLWNGGSYQCLRDEIVVEES